MKRFTLFYSAFHSPRKAARPSDELPMGTNVVLHAQAVLHDAYRGSSAISLIQILQRELEEREGISLCYAGASS